MVFFTLIIIFGHFPFGNISTKPSSFSFFFWLFSENIQNSLKIWLLIVMARFQFCIDDRSKFLPINRFWWIVAIPNTNQHTVSALYFYHRSSQSSTVPCLAKPPIRREKSTRNTREKPKICCRKTLVCTVLTTYLSSSPSF